ncbi:hypothetical protein D3C75_1088480 [compost metagenome]
MKVKELIEILEKTDQDINVCYYDGYSYWHNVESVDIELADYDTDQNPVYEVWIK